MKIIPISADSYGRYEGCRQVIHHSDARVFGEMDFGPPAGRFALAWRSTLIQPIVVVGVNAFWIGVDQRVVAIETQTGRIVFSLALPTNLLDIFVGDAVTVVVCDFNVIVLNLDNSIRSMHGVNDGIKDPALNGSRLDFSSFEGPRLHLDI